MKWARLTEATPVQRMANPLVARLASVMALSAPTMPSPALAERPVAAALRVKPVWRRRRAYS